MRLVPVDGRVAMCKPFNLKDKAVASPTTRPLFRSYKYRDPPRYEDVVDFGHTSEIHIELLVLQPTDNTVNASTPFCTSYLKKKIPYPELSGHVVGVVSTEAWHTLLGVAPWILRRSLWLGKGGDQQQISQSSSRNGIRLQGRSTIHIF